MNWQDDGRSPERAFAPARLVSWALLGAIIVVAGYFHFHALDWNDHGWPHPDERAVISQTYDMMVENHYMPTNYTWGHFGYYSALFTYKTYLYVQHWANRVPIEAPLHSDDGRRGTVQDSPDAPPGPRNVLPHFRDLAADGTLVPVGIVGVLLCCAAFGTLRAACRLRVAGAALSIGGLVLLWLLYRPVRDAMLIQVRPDYEDVALMGRFLAALAATLCIPLLYDLGRVLYSRRVGLLAAAFYGFTVLGVQLGHFFAVDMLQAFCVLLVLWAAAGIVRATPNPTANLEPRARDLGDIASGLALDPYSRYVLRVHHAISWTPLLLYLALGIAIGMSMASKFSSAPIFVVPVVAHVLFLHRARAARQFMPHLFLVLCYAMALGTWFYLQPYAWEASTNSAFVPYAEALRRRGLSERWLNILFSGEYARQIAEQSRMVKGEGGGPWVQQFANTVPFVTMTLQMVRWTFGWPLGVICVGGFVFAMVRNVFRPRAADLLLLSWAAAQFLTLGTFKATFPRYTMGIIPVVCLFGALLCLDEIRLPQTAGAVQRTLFNVWRGVRVPLAAVGVIGGFLYCVAYMSVYDRMHTWSYASLWIYKNVPQRQADGRQTRIIQEAWDDTIPLNVPPNPISYGSVRTEPYHGDGPAKVQRIGQWLEQADWICLPTTRLYGTTMCVPDKYEYTVRYYKNLFAGRLGYTLRKTVTRPATLWGWEFDDLLADESHRVYDHPKCVMFEKTQPLTAREYEERILNTPAEIDALTRPQILRWREAPEEQLRNLVRDPDPDYGVFTAAEVESLVRRAYRLSESETERLSKAVAGLSTTPAVSAGALRDLIGSVSGEITALRLGEIRAAAASLSTQPALRVRDLVAVARNPRTIDDPGTRIRLASHLVGYLEHETLARSEVLRKLDRIDLSAGQIPTPVDTPPATVREAPARKPLITQQAGGFFYQTWQVVKWLAAIVLLGIAVLPLCWRVFRDLPDEGYPLARILGFVLATYLVWLAVNLHLAYFTRATCFAALAGMGAACWLAPWRGDVLRMLVRQRRVVLATEILFFATFFVFLAVRAYNPEIFWGEKPMDYSLYNSVMRGTTLPPYEPWFSGTLLNYYYYGFILVAYLTLLAGTPTAFGFNLAMAAVPALSVLCAFSLAYNLGRKVRWGLLGAAFVGFIGNFDPVYQLWTGGQLKQALGLVAAPEAGLLGRLWALLIGPFKAVYVLLFVPHRASMWDSFWDQSRAIGDGMINEFPVWSWLFADLHAHVLVMPLSLLILSFVYLFFRTRRGQAGCPGDWRRDAAAFGLLAIVVGSAMTCNMWDFLSYTGFLLLALAVRAAAPSGAEGPAPLVRFPAFAEVRAAGPGAPDPFLEQHRPSLLVSVLVLAGFVPVWAAVWPALSELHPYWLGCVRDWWIGALIALGIVVAALARPTVLRLTDRVSDAVWRAVRDAALPVAGVVLLSLAFFYHFHAHVQTGDAQIKLNNDGNIQLYQALRHFGFFAVLTVAWVAMSYLRAFGRRAPAGDGTVPHPAGPLAAGLLLAILVAPVLRALGFWQSAPGLLLYAYLLAAVASCLFLWRKRTDHLFCGTLLLGGWGIAAVSELVVIIDRMNTVFKLYHHAWMLLALGCAAGVAAMRNEWMGGVWGRWRTNSMWDLFIRPVRALACVLFAAMFVLVLVCPFRGAVGVMTHWNMSAKPTLYGLDYLGRAQGDPELLEAVDWLNRNVAGPQVIAEAFTNQGYAGATRVVMYTGLPTLLGWPHHTKQRGHTDQEIQLRSRDLRTLYLTEETSVARDLCRQYDIRYIFVGDLERRTYGDPLPRLRQHDFLEEVFTSSGGRNTIFAVRATSGA